MTGWLRPETATSIPVMQKAGIAKLTAFYATPNRVAVVRLTDHEHSEEPQYLICDGTSSICMETMCEYQDLTCSRESLDRVVLADADNKLKIQCYAARILDQPSYNAWSGDDGEAPDTKTCRTTR